MVRVVESSVPLAGIAALIEFGAFGAKEMGFATAVDPVAFRVLLGVAVTLNTLSEIPAIARKIPNKLRALTKPDFLQGFFFICDIDDSLMTFAFCPSPAQMPANGPGPTLGGDCVSGAEHEF
jgi:hypothetical protein